MKITLADIKAAQIAIADHVLRTPLLAAPHLAALTGAEVYVDLFLPRDERGGIISGCRTR